MPIDTQLTMKQLVPVRLIKNKFYNDVQDAENRCASNDELHQLLGRGRAKLGMFEGNLDEVELEIGQVAAMLNDVPSANEIVKNILQEFKQVTKNFR